jgi:hypothetical protein
LEKVIQRFKSKPTLFLILCTITFICGVPGFIYAIGLPGGASLGAILPAGAMFIAAAALWIDHRLVNHSKIKLGWISVIEAGILVCLFIFGLYSDKSASVNVQNKKQDHLIIIDSPNGLQPKDFKVSWLFSKKYDIKNQEILYLNESAFTDYPIKVRSESGGLSVRFGYKPKYKFNWSIYFFDAKGQKDYTDQELDSLISLQTKLN